MMPFPSARPLLARTLAASFASFAWFALVTGCAVGVDSEAAEPADDATEVMGRSQQPLLSTDIAALGFQSIAIPSTQTLVAKRIAGGASPKFLKWTAKSYSGTPRGGTLALDGARTTPVVATYDGNLSGVSVAPPLASKWGYKLTELTACTKDPVLSDFIGDPVDLASSMPRRPVCPRCCPDDYQGETRYRRDLVSWYLEVKARAL